MNNALIQTAISTIEEPPPAYDSSLVVDPVSDPTAYCKPCKRQLKNAFGLTMHRITFHQKRGFVGKQIAAAQKRKGKLKLRKGAVVVKRKRGRPKGSTTKKSKAFCELCKKPFKNAHGLSVHNAQVHVAGVSNRHKHDNLVVGGNVRASSQAKTHAHNGVEEVNLAFLAGALCERLILSPGHELLAELVTGRLSASRMGSPQVR